MGCGGGLMKGETSLLNPQQEMWCRAVNFDHHLGVYVSFTCSTSQCINYLGEMEQWRETITLRHLSVLELLVGGKRDTISEQGTTVVVVVVVVC